MRLLPSGLGVQLLGSPPAAGQEGHRIRQCGQGASRPRSPANTGTRVGPTPDLFLFLGPASPQPGPAAHTRGAGFLPPARKLPPRSGPLRPKSAPAPWRRLRGRCCASPQGVFHKWGWWRALMYPYAHTRVRGRQPRDPAGPGKGRPRGCPARGRGPRPLPRPRLRPKLLAGTRHRHVRAVGSWQVSKMPSSPGGGRSAFPDVFPQEKKDSALCRSLPPGRHLWVVSFRLAFFF